MRLPGIRTLTSHYPCLPTANQKYAFADHVKKSVNPTVIQVLFKYIDLRGMLLWNNLNFDA